MGNKFSCSNGKSSLNLLAIGICLRVSALSITIHIIITFVFWQKYATVFEPIAQHCFFDLKIPSYDSPSDRHQQVHPCKWFSFLLSFLQALTCKMTSVAAFQGIYDALIAWLTDRCRVWWKIFDANVFQLQHF